ncbi:mechanosensitive ion channel family protein [Sulfitobacter sp. TSTF-M16]|uniref:Mechanosensitive ion channel family protein n=1 Tax=Sulfitobacter aestuariivivens TaxID=2766981 RepID=A0A927D6T2_9RHOB|nr:mechanosensitive ion channel family protein [Sulfitobacter aestuariivivens]MBD3664577.1 mechanosensitive ion channel family protein [Sulfitobacter aestuariivivens]
MRLLMVICLLVGLAAAGQSGPAQAQGLGSLLANSSKPDAPETDTIDDILDRAAQHGVGVIVIDSDGNVISQPAMPEETPHADAAPEQSPLMVLQDRAVSFRSALIERLLQLPAAFNEVAYILRAASPDGTLWAFGKTLLLSLLLLAIGSLVESKIFGKRIMKGAVTRRIKDNPQGYIEKMPFLVFRFVTGVVGILVSMVVAYALGFIIFGPLTDTAIQFTATLINIGYFCCRFVAGLWRMILSPFLEQYRIPALANAEALRLHRWLWMMATFDICAILFGIWIGELGLNYEVYAFLASMLSALIVLLNILLVLVNRRAITRALRNGKPLEECSMVVRVLCKVWAPVVILYVIFAWFELTYDLVLGNPSAIPLIAGAYGILITIIVVYGLFNYFIERSFARASAMRRLNALNEEEEAEAAALAEARAAHEIEDAARIEEDLERTREEAAEEEARAVALGPRRQLNTFEELARRVAGIIAFVAGAYAFFYIWDNDGAEMVESYADRLLDIMVIIFIGYVVYHAFRIWIDSKIEEESGDIEEAELGDEGGGSSASRLATLLPLFRNFMLIVVVVTILLIVLMEVGVNVGPLFAGAGIVGIAIGFGSQALVRDVFAGAFFLFDDAFRKGEYLDVGNVKGTVEKISVRSFQLRHHLGALHTIPFGELQVITNYSRDWVMMKLPLRVTYDTDVEKVRKLIKKLGVDLLDDPVIGENFIQPLKSQGVIEMQDSAMIIRVKFMTKPGDQWLVRKRVYEEIRVLFEREGIKFAHREVTVRLAGDKVDELTEEQKRDIAAAAHASLEEDDLDGGQDGGGDDR